MGTLRQSQRTFCKAKEASAPARPRATRKARALALAIVLGMVVPSVWLPIAAVAQDAEPQSSTPVPANGRYLVEYASAADVPNDAYFTNLGFSVLYRFGSIPAVAVQGSPDAERQLHANPRLDHVEADHPIQLFLDTADFSTRAADVWGSAWWPVPSEVQRQDPSPIMVDGQPVDGRGVVVGIVDSGINGGHPDLWYAPAYDPALPWEPKVLACFNDPAQADAGAPQTPDCDQSVGHGTHVAGIVAGNAFAARNGMAPGVSRTHPPMGVAPGAKLVGMGLGGGLFILNAQEGLDWMAMHHREYNIRVVTNSWGNAGDCANALPNNAVNQITNRLIDEGVTVLFAMGNYDTTGNPTWTSPYSINPKPGLIGVSNYNDQNTGTRDGAVNDGSSDGCVKSGGAEDLLWTWPDVGAPGTDILSTAAYTGTLIPGLNGAFYGTASGTSMATPHVAGIVALMLQANPDLTPAQIERILIETSTPWGDAISERGVSGTVPMWGPSAKNNPTLGFSDPSLCKVTPTDAAKAKLGDTSVNAKFPRFTELAQITDPDLYICRDFKRGHGLVDAYAAVQRALALRDDQTGSPTVTITDPADGAQVDPGLVPVQGVVDRLGQSSNQAPAAALAGSPLSGSAPLTVSFTIAGNDPDGTIASWSLDFADGSPPATGTSVPASASHTYNADGIFAATLRVTDDRGATAAATVSVSVGGLPVPDGAISGSVFAYNEGGVGLSNVGALVTETVTSDAVPKYLAGETVSVAVRSALSNDPDVPINTGTQVALLIYDEAGHLVLGPLPMAGGEENPTLTSCAPQCKRYDASGVTFGVDWNGIYYLAPRATVNGIHHFVLDTNSGGLKKIQVLGAPDSPVGNGLPSGPGSRFSRDGAPIKSGSEADPEGDDATGDTNFPFMDITKVWVGPETATTFDVHLKVADMSQLPPAVDVSTPAGRVRVSINYGLSFCLDNNVNRASGDGTFCYRLSAVNAVTGANFGAGVIQQDNSGSCGFADMIVGGAFDIPNSTVTWRLSRPAFNITANSADVAACTASPTTTPPTRDGSGIVDGTTLSKIAGSTGFSAGARVILTTGAGGDTSDGGNARPFVFGGPSDPLVAEAGGPYSGLVNQAIAIAASATGGASPYGCAWSGSGAFANAAACVTSVTFTSPGAQTLTLTVTDSRGATSTDTATVNVGTLAGERVELSLDGETSPRASLAVSTSSSAPTATFSGSLNLAGMSGAHSVTARWFDADGALLASDTHGFTLGTGSGAAYVTIATPGDDPNGANPLQGTIPLQGQAGHNGPGSMAGADLNAHGMPLASGSRAGLRSTMETGEILAPCAACQSQKVQNQEVGNRLSSSVTWQTGGPDSITDGLDGKWFAVGAYQGGNYTLTAEFGSPMDIWFFNDVVDAQSASVGKNVGPDMPKTGIVPAAANYAFVYLRRPTPGGLVDQQGIDDSAQLLLTPLIVRPSAPQNLEVTPQVTALSLTWGAPANNGGEAIGGYKIYRDGALLTTLGGNTRVYTDAAIPAGASHTYQVTASNSAGEGAPSNSASGAALAPGANGLTIVNPANGASQVAATTLVDGAFKPLGSGSTQPPAAGNFANTHYFFLMNLNDVCGDNLGFGDILIASKLIDHARSVLGVPAKNIHFFNQDGRALNPGNDAGTYAALPSAYQNGDAYEGKATFSNFVNSLKATARTAALGEAAGGAPARVFVMHSSHGLWAPGPVLNSRVFGSLMCLNGGEDVTDAQFGAAVTDALDKAENGTTVKIESAILIDCSFCGGFADSPLWFPGTTTTAVDSSHVVGPNRVVEVGCTWITECFGNPAVTYDHIFNICVIQGQGDGYGPMVRVPAGGNPLPGGQGQPGDDVVVPNRNDHAKDGAITLEEGYWCALDSVKGPLGNAGGSLDAIGVQQMFQLVDQMPSDMFGQDGFVLWDLNHNLNLPTRNRSQGLPQINLALPRSSAADPTGDAKAPFSDLTSLDATATSSAVIADLGVADLTLSRAEAEDLIEYRITINGNPFGVCYSLGAVTIYGYALAGGSGAVSHGVATYDFAANKIHVEIPLTELNDATLPAEVHATSQYGECSVAAPGADDRIPDAGEVSTSTGGSTTNPGTDEVRVSLDGPGATHAAGIATLNIAAKTWSFDPPGDLAEGAWTATVEHWFDDGSGFVKVDGPVTSTFNVQNIVDNVPPTAPGNLRVTGTTTSSVSTAWDAAIDNLAVVTYNVYRAGAPGVQATQANFVASTSALSFQDPGLIPATTYYYAVEAEDARGNRGPLSNEIAATTSSVAQPVEKVSLDIDGNPYQQITVDSATQNPASWATTLNTASLANGLHTLTAAYDDGAGGSASAQVRFNVQNGVSLAFTSPAENAGVSQAFTARGSASGAASGAVVQLRVTTGGGSLVQDWTAADNFDGTTWDKAFAGMPTGALTVDARLRAAGSTQATATLHVRVLDEDRILIETANGQPVASAGALGGVPRIAGSSHLGAEASGANEPPVAVISNVVVVGRSLGASGAGSYDPDGTIKSYAWDLGDGQTRSGAQLSYAYAAAGTYTITLTVTDNRGAAGQATFGPFQVTNTNPAAFAVDAGDSQFVALGQPVALSAIAYGAQGAVSYAWDTDGNNLPDRMGQTIEVDTTGFAAGPRAFKVIATDSAGGQGTDTVPVYLYVPQQVNHRFEADVPVGVNDEDLGASGGLDMATRQFHVQVPTGSTRIEANLDWNIFADVVPPNPVISDGGGPNDMDLYVYGPDGYADSSAKFRAPEHVTVVAPAGGDWTFEVRPYVVVADHYVLDVDVSEAPPNPVPRANQVNEVCFDTPTQTLVAEASVATGDALSGAWDLDNDGAFDDATGFTATTNFPLDAAAHLVRFRATTASGFRATILVGVRPLTQCPANPGVVVVAVADTGVNAYAKDFAGELMPYPELRAFTTSDPQVPLSNDAPVRHKLTNAMLPFTKHPSRYIPGYPADAAPLVLTLGGGYYKSLDDARLWSKGHNAIPINKLFWIPGTKIIGAIDGSDAQPINGAPDTVPILDEDGHGTASASVAVGNFFGSCPKCVLFFGEGLSSDTLFFKYPFIDFVSVSGGAVANVGTPGLTDVSASKAAAERGQTISYAAGNGNANAFESVEQTYLSESTGPAWHIRVGAVSKGSDSSVVTSGKPDSWSSYGSGAIAASCPNNYAGNCGHSGTSAATPIATGHMGSILLAARQAIGDSAAGQKTPAQAGGKLQAVAVGQGIPGNPWLGDGVLQRPELWNVAFHCASSLGTGVGYPGEGPASPIDYAYAGYGIANAAAQTCAINALLTGSALPSRPDADQFAAIDNSIREELWGTWDGNADGQDGGLGWGAGSLHLPTQDITPASLASPAKVADVLRGLYRYLGQVQNAPAATETYYLHHTGGCDSTNGGQDSMDQTNSAGDNDGCGGIGTPPLLGESVAPAATWGSTVPSRGFAAGTHAAGTVYLDFIHPGAPLVQVALLSGGLEVGRSAVLQPVSTAAFGATGYTAYAFDIPTTATIAADDLLELDLFIQGSESYFVGYEGSHASGFTLTGQGGGGGPSGPAATISSPAQGAQLDAALGTVTVSGTATFPAGSGVVTRAWLRYDGDATTCGARALSLQDGPDGGNGCAKTFAVAGGLLDIFDDYPADFTPTSLQPGAHVTGKIYFGTLGPDAGQALFVLRGDGAILGSQDVTFTGLDVGLAGGPAEVDLDFPLDGLTSTAPIDALVFEIHYEQASPFQYTSHDNPASYLDLPFAGGSTGGVVQVSVDDPTFATGQLVVTGSTAWSAPWNLAGVPEGPHTLYARAGQGSTFGPADSVGVVVVAAQQGTRVGAVEVQAVPEGTAPGAAAWLAASAYSAGSGAWSYNWDTTGLPNGRYDFHARLLGDGLEAARDVWTASVANQRAPILATIGNKAVPEGQLLEFTVTASDLDNDPLAFTVSNPPSGATFVDHGDGTATFRWTPSFSQAGNYNGVHFEVRDPSGRSDVEDITITVGNVNRPPVLAPIGDKTVVEGDELQFTISATDPDGPGLTYSASGLPAGATFNAGTQQFAWTPGFDQAGDSMVTFTASDGNAQDSETITIHVVDWLPPVAAFTAAPNPADRVTDVQFTDASAEGSGPIASRAWTFGDGATSTATDPAHRYAQLGTFTATLTVRDGKNQATSASRDIVVRNLAPSLQPTGDRDLYEGDLVEIVAQGSDPEGDALTYSASNLPQGATFDAAQRKFSWTPGFTQAGAYDVTFTVSDGLASASQVSHLVVRDWIPPTSAFTAAPNPSDRLTSVQFTDGSTPGTGAITTRAWNFGDGATSTATNPSHKYANLGTFVVSLTVADGKGQGSTTTRSVTVQNLLPSVAGTASPTETDRSTPVQFTDRSTDRDGSIVSRLWDFGDGATSAAANPSHTYASLGSKRVTLTVTDNDGGSATAEIARIAVKNHPPRAAFTGGEGNANRADPVQFADASTDADRQPLLRAWSFGDGATSAAANPAHQYATLGDFLVTLVVTDPDGDSDVATRLVHVVNLAPTANFTVNPEVPMALQPASFVDGSGDRDGGVTTWVWEFGDGATSTERNPYHPYLRGGSYLVNLTVGDAQGATARMQKRVFVCDPGGANDATADPTRTHLSFDVCVRQNQIQYPDPSHLPILG